MSDLFRLLPTIEPLRAGPLRMTDYIAQTAGVSLGDLQAALSANLLTAAYPAGGPSPVVLLLPAGSALLKEVG